MGTADVGRRALGVGLDSLSEVVQAVEWKDSEPVGIQITGETDT